MRLPEPSLGAEHPVNRLRTAWAALEAFCATPSCTQELRAAVGFLLDGLKRFDEQAGAGVTLHAALGLGNSHGGRSWVRAQALADRDRLLRDIRKTRLGNMDDGAAAEAILAELSALDRRRDLRDGTLPSDLACANLCARIPRTKKQLEKILAGNRKHD